MTGRAQEPQPRFEFGLNWTAFVRERLTPERLEESRRRIQEFHGRSHFEGAAVLDIGCGSGLSSLAFATLGARVTAFDLDSRCVEVSAGLLDGRGARVLSGDVLDSAFMSGLGRFDLVYAWGSLHHTGDLARALAHSFAAVAPGGRLHLALYTRFSRDDDSLWTRRKKAYCRAPPWRRRCLEGIQVLRQWVWPSLRRLENPWRAFQRAQEDALRSRGMDALTDLRDWLGGYPYETMAIEDAVRFGAVRWFGLVNIRPNRPPARITEYLFADMRGPEPASLDAG